MHSRILLTVKSSHSHHGVHSWVPHATHKDVDIEVIHRTNCMHLLVAVEYETNVIEYDACQLNVMTTVKVVHRFFTCACYYS